MMDSDKKIIIFKHSRAWTGDRCSRLLSEMGYQIEWCYPHEGGSLPDPQKYRAAIILGCRNSVNDHEDWIQREIIWVESCLKSDCAFLGICFGGQLLAKVLGARVAKHEEHLTEVGFTELFPGGKTGSNFPTPPKLFQWHKEGFDLPASSTLLCSSHRFPNQAFQYTETTYGFQFHPEVNQFVMSQWFETNDDYDSEGLDRASRARHLKYAEQHDKAISNWFSGFLQQWLKE
jgi:GMP synthase (glutamine-hydrolysing)